MTSFDGHTVELWAPLNEAEGLGMASVLESQGVECILVRNQDTAYPGIVDGARPWGTLRVPGGEYDRALAIITEWRSADPEDAEAAYQRASAHEAARASSSRPKSPVMAALLSLAVPGAGQVYAGRASKGSALLVGIVSLWTFHAPTWAILLLHAIASTDAFVALRSAGGYDAESAPRSRQNT